MKLSDKNLLLLIYLSLAMITFVAYYQVLSHDFIRYDDDVYVFENSNVTSGISIESAKWALTTPKASNWHPLTWLSHMLDCQLFDLNPGLHHLTNLFFHIANTLLLFAVFKNATSRIWTSAFVAAIFALHPLHIESVAWVAERKDLLSTFFWLLTMLTYLYYTERKTITRYALSLLFFALGLMAKPMLVTLPFVLLLFDYWPLERFSFTKDKFKNITRLIIEKIPFFLITIASCIITFFVQKGGGAVLKMEVLGINSRIRNAIVSYVVYIEKMFWPRPLAVLYPLSITPQPILIVTISALILLTLTAVLLYLGLKKKYLLFGWLWYIGTLVPVIGLIQVGVQAHADRYTYIPLIGLFVIIAWSIPDLLAKLPNRKFILTTSALIILAASTIATFAHLKHWKNSITLFAHTLSVTENNYIMHSNYGNVLKDQGKVYQAIEHFNKALRIKPDFTDVNVNLGNALADLDRFDEAIHNYKKAINAKPNFEKAHYNLAVALAKKGQKDQAIKEYNKTLELDPGNFDAWKNLGTLLSEKGDYLNAAQCFEKAIELKPNFIVAQGQLGLALANLGKTDQAIEKILLVLEVFPEDVEMHFNLGYLYQKQGKIQQAINQYQKALQIDPGYQKAKQFLDQITNEGALK